MRRIRAEYLRRNGATVVRFTGDVDLSSIHAFDDRLAAAEAMGDPWIVADLTCLGFIDSAGLASLARLEHRLSAAGRGLSLLASSERIGRVVRIGGLGPLLRYSPVPDRAAAGAAGRAGTGPPPRR